MRRTSTVWLALVLAVAMVAAACGDDDGGGQAAPVIEVAEAYAPDIGPEDFVDGIDNPLLPFTPGSRWVYEGMSDGELERIEVVVTDERREVMGVSAVVVRDTVTVDGELEEDTFDWYAQDRDGNVWYLGEDSTEYSDGEAVSTEGSWEAGVDGALPGIVMPADPQLGSPYRQEFYEGEAEDLAEVASLTGTETVPFGSFENLLVTTEWTPLEPDVVEQKYYAEGIGVVLEVVTAGGEGRVELIEFSAG